MLPPRLRLDWIDMALFVGVLAAPMVAFPSFARSPKWAYACVLLAFLSVGARRGLFPASVKTVERRLTGGGFFATAVMMAGALAVLTAVLVYAHVYAKAQPPTREQIDAEGVPEVHVARSDEDPEVVRRRWDAERQETIDRMLRDRVASFEETHAWHRRVLLELGGAGVALVAVGALIDRFRR